MGENCVPLEDDIIFVLLEEERHRLIITEYRDSDGISTGFRRDSDGISTGFRRDSDGIPTGFRRDSDGIDLVLHFSYYISRVCFIGKKIEYRFEAIPAG